MRCPEQGDRNDRDAPQADRRTDLRFGGEQAATAYDHMGYSASLALD